MCACEWRGEGEREGGREEGKEREEKLIIYCLCILEEK